MGRVEGKVALISGGARGQGEAEARLLVIEGAKVVIGDVLDTEGRAVVADLGTAARYQHLDVRREDDWQAAVAAAVEVYGRLDVLVNNAGIVRVGAVADMTVEDYMAVVEVNQLGCFLGMKTAIPAMKASGGGSIVNISSTGGLHGVPFTSAYAATKFAIRGMTKVAAIEVGHDGIRVNSVHPGSIDTPMIHSPEFVGVDKVAYYSHLPVPRMGEAEDVANMVLFLASDESSYCTGTEFVVDGGMLAGRPTQGITDRPSRDPT
jgi:3alpha(or 20beta)-hydroxysteroid dehydrogenase